MDVGTEDAHSLLVDMSVRGLAVAEAFRQTLVKIETDRTAAGKYSARNDRGRWPPTLLSPREMFQPPEVITQELWWLGHPRLANPCPSGFAYLK